LLGVIADYTVLSHYEVSKLFGQQRFKTQEIVFSGLTWNRNARGVICPTYIEGAIPIS